MPERTPLLDHMLHVCMFRCVELDVVLGQDLHDGPDLQPPLRPGDAVSAVDRPELIPHSDNTECTEGKRGATYSKSVSSFSSARGWNMSALFLMPRTQAESGVLAKIRPRGQKSVH